MGKMELYNKYAEVPKEAQRPIASGRLKGKTDINPMWRIKCLTEMFGPCGLGWYTKIVSKHIDEGANGEAVATIELALYIKDGSEWSMPIIGVGGSTFIAKETKGLYTSDEAYKMAYTDALSVCCKMLGIGANVYWAAGNTKYDAAPKDEKPAAPKLVCIRCKKEIKGFKSPKGTFTAEQWAEMSRQKYEGNVYCLACAKQIVIPTTPKPDPSIDGLTPPPEGVTA